MPRRRWRGSDLLGHLIVGGRSQRLGAIGFHLVDQFQSQHEPAAQAFEFDPQQARQFTAVTGAQFG